MSTKSPSLDAHVLSTTVGTGETTIAHTLGRVPEDAFITLKSANSNIYRGPTAWTSSNIYLQASVAATVTLLLF